MLVRILDNFLLVSGEVKAFDTLLNLGWINWLLSHLFPPNQQLAHMRHLRQSVVPVRKRFTRTTAYLKYSL
ncbi:hypothetical protein KSD_75320 [Ktedonobacter sp. SOSP1-85]|nr:hypothetical protein KSD_75320 [Ktedonobacter sp. SOSP1-85]